MEYEEEIYEGRQIHNHPFKKDGFSLLETYPGVRQLLEKKVKSRARDIRGWNEFVTPIQYRGWTCEASFIWSYRDGHYYVDDVKLFAVRKAPPESEQYENQN